MNQKINYNNDDSVAPLPMTPFCFDVPSLGVPSAMKQARCTLLQLSGNVTLEPVVYHYVNNIPDL
jgi:hypothetical protein